MLRVLLINVTWYVFEGVAASKAFMILIYL